MVLSATGVRKAGHKVAARWATLISNVDWMRRRRHDMSLLAELKRRKVFKVGAAYLVIAWLAVQGASIGFPAFDAPPWALRIFILVALLGFPVTVVMAWVFDVTPEGVTFDPDTSGSKRLFAAGGLLAMLALGWYFYGQPAFRKGNVESKWASSVALIADRKSIAVLPLVNLGGDPKDDYLGDGISEEVLNALSKLQGLKVIGRASSFQFRGRDVDAAKVGHALNVRNLLSGTVQRAGDDLRITVELIDTTNGLQVWSQNYDRTFKNLFALEDDISGAVSKALAIKLGAATGQPLVAVATSSPHAHDLLLRAKQMAAHSDEVSLNQAVTLYNQAIAEDPNYAAAWAGLASTYAFLADAYRAPIDLMASMKGAAEKAVALDPALADGHVFLGYALMADEHDFPAARRESERGVALNPGSADAHMFMGLYLLEAEHDPAAARAELRTAQKLDPRNSWNLYTEMWAATAAGDSAGVLALAQRIHGSDPKFFYLSDPLVYAYAMAGRWQECIDRSAVAQAAADNPADFAAAICHAHAGNTARAREILAQLEAAARTRYVDSSDIAAIRAALGDNDGAFAALEQAYRDRSQPLLNLWFLPWFKPLHGDPRYQALLDKIYASLKAPLTP
jgi:TolB-like protein